MTTTTRLDPAAITPETILAAARKWALELRPGRTFLLADDDRPVECCPLGALALEVDPTVAPYTFAVRRALQRAGLSSGWLSGVIQGFDGGRRENVGAGSHKGHALGRATRRAAGLDAGGEGKGPGRLVNAEVAAGERVRGGAAEGGDR